MPLIALCAFWICVVRLWIIDGPRTPLKFIVAWILGLVVTILMNQPALFIAWESILTITLIFIHKRRSL